MTTWNLNLPGQDDVGLYPTQVGDKTITKAISTSHVRIQNKSDQPILYSIVEILIPPPPPPPIARRPEFPSDWQRLEPEKEVIVAMEGSTELHLRKKIWYRTLINQYNDPKDVQARVIVEEVNYA